MSSAWPASHVPSSLWPEDPLEARTAASFCIWERGGLLHGASAEPRCACPATAAAVQLLRSSCLLPAAALPAAPATASLLMAAFPCRQSWRAKKHCSGGQCLPWWWGWWWCCGCGGVCVCVRVGGVVCAPRTHPDGIMPIHLRATGGRCLAFWLATTVAMNHSHRPAHAWGSCRWPLSHRRLAAEHLDLDARRLGPPSASSSGPHANTVLMSLTTFEPCDPGFYKLFRICSIRC